ncbi:MAG: alpha-glucan family phosphorylase [Chloroflexota bacterium]|nr:alpha-glucan family phosphorylase [Chloroflexota bacterium]
MATGTLKSSIAVAPILPDRLQRLNDLAYNLWWSWHPPARALFRDLHPSLWEACDQNPVLFLHRVTPERLATALADPAYMSVYEEVTAAFDEMLTEVAPETWLARHQPELLDRTVAYLSAEFGLHRALPIYSGGLGVLAGDHMKEASDLGLPIVGVSLLYRHGYLRQRLNAEGWQQDVHADLDPLAEPTVQVCDGHGDPIIIDVHLDQPNNPLRLAVWRVHVGRVPLYLLDSDVEGTPDWTRTTSSRLYGGDRDHRLRQEIILGIGGVRLLRALKIEPAYWHANEGHAALHLLERIRELVKAGTSFEEAAESIRATTVFTSHTPVPAGHDVFSVQMMDHYFSQYYPQIGLDRDAFLALGRHSESGDGFNLTALSMRLAGFRNGVSKRHGEITRAMWHDIWPGVEPKLAPISSITNGVHLPTWVSPRIAKLFDTYLGADWRGRQEDPLLWEGVRSIPPVAFWRTHLAAKQDLHDLLDERARVRWAEGDFDPTQVVSSGPFMRRDILTLGFARRFATYKRATLLFRDPDRLARILTDVERPVQIVFAGKAHPADEDGKKLIQEIYNRAREPRFGGRIAFAEDYDMGLAAALVAGVDVWLNTPRAPMEASGTSGMKAAANGVLNASILDGWWSEGWRSDNSNGWGVEPSALNVDDQDHAEAEAFFDLLEQSVIPLYYARGIEGLPDEWIEMALEAIRTLAPSFSARRMLIEYIQRLYRPASGLDRS